MKHITATLINIYHVCHRKLWLHANEIRLEHTSQTVAEGKLLGETSYPQRAEKWTELAIDGIKIDFFDAKNGIVHEVKKSDKMETADIAQVKYYLFVLERNGIFVSHGLLEFPKQKETLRVDLTDEDRRLIPIWEAEILAIIDAKTCPPTIDKPFCKQCSFYDFCYMEEAD
jgi:CRISPR-associated exonuclease Cas4